MPRCSSRRLRKRRRPQLQRDPKPPAQTTKSQKGRSGRRDEDATPKPNGSKSKAAQQKRRKTSIDDVEEEEDHDSNDAPEERVCPKCEEPVSGKYCSYCGARAQ